MDLRSISANQITLWLMLALGLVVALVIGSAVGNSDIRFVAAAMAVIPVLVIFTHLKTNIWVLLPIGWYLTGTLPWFPLPLSLRNLCFLAVIAVFILLVATRAVPWKRKGNMLEYLIYLNLAYLITVFIRNPTGFLALQSSMVGGRPYMEVILAFAAFLILSRVRISDSIARIFPLFFVIPTWSVGILDAIGRVYPPVGYVLNSFYSGAGLSGTFGAVQGAAEVGTTRLVGLQDAGVCGALFLCARYNPITLISPLYPWRVIMTAMVFGVLFLAGFRSLILFAFVAFFLSSILRGKLHDLWITICGGVLILAFLIALQGNVLQLPLTMQRALSWLPGDWNQEAVMSGKASTQWRVEMWEWAWNDDQILRNKIWGQGFGFTLDDMNLISKSLAAGQGGSSLLGGSDRELFMINGTFHSGPLSTVKYIGIVGFCLYLPLMCYMGRLAWRLCKKARGTKAFTLALFVGIPIIYEPFNFILLFGGLDGNYPQLLFWAGLLNMTSNYLDSVKAKDIMHAENASLKALKILGTAPPRPKTLVPQKAAVIN